MREHSLPEFEPVHEIHVADGARVFEHGWQSFSPTTTYTVGGTPFRPVSERNRILNYRQDSLPGRDVYFGEGVLAVDDGSNTVHVVAADDPFTTGVRLRAEHTGSTLIVSADGPAMLSQHERSGSDPVQRALGEWAAKAAETAGLAPAAAAPTGWCSWYSYYGDVTEQDIEENLDAMRRLDLDVDVVQIDDGYEAEIGDWLTPAPRFSDVRAVADRIKQRGVRAGIWVAPFFVGSRSRVSVERPEWLVRHPHGGARHAGNNWGQDLYAIDITEPGAAAWIRSVFETFASWGIDYFKIDFLAAGTVPGARWSGADPVTAYREGLQLIRDAVGPEAHLLGCGAPILPSVGFVDSMRVSADTDAAAQPGDGDLSSPGQRGAALSARGRQFMNGVFFANDPDCLIVGSHVEKRAHWADHVAAVDGAVVSSDRLAALDEWGVDTTRRLLSEARSRGTAP